MAGTLDPPAEYHHGPKPDKTTNRMEFADLRPDRWTYKGRPIHLFASG